MNVQKIVLATNNPGKVSELMELLAGFAVEIIPQKDFAIASVAETGTTFVENAIIKARHASTLTSLPAIADDSGIEVDYLLGAPGVASSHYSGKEGNFPEHIDKLLQALDGVALQQRTARFRCTLVYLRHPNDPAPLIAQGCWEGRILTARQGEHGFGYDPIFFVPEFGCSAAELTQMQKNQLSHRGQALRALLDQMTKEFSPMK